MKRFAIFLLTALLMISLLACGNGADVAQTTPSEGTGEPIAPTQAVTENAVTKPSENVTEDSTDPTEGTVHEHDFSIEQKTVPATCTSKGYTVYECECGETKNGNETVIAPAKFSVLQQSFFTDFLTYNKKRSAQAKFERKGSL